MDCCEGGGSQPMWIIFKSANVDSGEGGGEDAYPQNVNKKTCFLTPPLQSKNIFNSLLL